MYWSEYLSRGPCKKSPDIVVDKLDHFLALEGLTPFSRKVAISYFVVRILFLFPSKLKNLKHGKVQTKQ